MTRLIRGKVISMIIKNSKQFSKVYKWKQNSFMLINKDCSGEGGREGLTKKKKKRSRKVSLQKASKDC